MTSIFEGRSTHLKQGLNSYQNKGPHLGSRYVHMQNICLACPN